MASEFRILTELLTEPHLSAMFGPGVPIHFVPDTRRQPTIPKAEDFSINAVEKTFDTLGHNAATFIPARPKIFQDLIQEVSNVAKESLGT